jgi:mRNA-degrading endonuclease YafQ of YafQ-DinJ toxin-antitoxin module
MGIKNIFTHSRFDKSYGKLPKAVKNKAEIKEKIFRENPFDPRLGTHKLSGKERECWAFDIDRVYRIKFIFLTGEEVLFLDIGTHDIYK